MGLLSTESLSSGSDSESSEVESSLSELLLDTVPASEEPELPEVPESKPKPWCGNPRKPCIAKDKVYKIQRGTCMTWRQCTLCRKQFAKQIELNHHTEEDHDYKFLCSQQTCKSHSHQKQL